VFLVSLVLGTIGVACHLLTHRVQGDYFDSNAVRVHYTDEGVGEPVVLLHGFAVNADLNWRRPGILDALKKDFRVIAMDLRGHGLSGKPHEPDKYGMEMVNDVVRLLDHLHIQKVHIVGYSLGGFIALRLAVTNPERVLTVAPLGSGWEQPDKSAFLQALADMARDLESGKGVGPISARLGGQRQKPGFLHTCWVTLMTRYFNDRLALVGVLKGIPELAVTEQQLRGMSIPVCSIVGERDPLRIGAEAMKGIVPCHELTIIQGADHLRAPMRSELRETLSRFLSAHKTIGAPAVP
jgi:pimeloyl-ACP methyl ester carboxylesterase